MGIGAPFLFPKKTGGEYRKSNEKQGGVVRRPAGKPWRVFTLVSGSTTYVGDPLVSTWAGLMSVHSWIRVSPLPCCTVCAGLQCRNEAFLLSKPVQSRGFSSCFTPRMGSETGTVNRRISAVSREFPNERVVKREFRGDG